MKIPLTTPGSFARTLGKGGEMFWTLILGLILAVWMVDEMSNPRLRPALRGLPYPIRSYENLNRPGKGNSGRLMMVGCSFAGSREVLVSPAAPREYRYQPSVSQRGDSIPILSYLPPAHSQFPKTNTKARRSDLPNTSCASWWSVLGLSPTERTSGTIRCSVAPVGSYGFIHGRNEMKFMKCGHVPHPRKEEQGSAAQQPGVCLPLWPDGDGDHSQAQAVQASPAPKAFSPVAIAVNHGGIESMTNDTFALSQNSVGLGAVGEKGPRKVLRLARVILDAIATRGDTRTPVPSLRYLGKGGAGADKSAVFHAVPAKSDEADKRLHHQEFFSKDHYDNNHQEWICRVLGNVQMRSATSPKNIAFIL
ncbi:hypothetical protein BC826DRAFT_969159 [Russula brevipes]|nr:hypothetical protein BC826DRAFT_969159 [Russula brevipes]